MPDQVVRLVVVFVVLGAVLVILRGRFVPSSFGEAGHYRGEALNVARAIPVRFAGTTACVECHDDVGEAKAASYHRTLACEVCHGAGSAHVEAPDEVKPRIPTGRENCLRCHGYRISRPTGFPQVLELSHNPDQGCPECHNPHDPTPPETPESCGACHGNIAALKAVSHHRRVPCTVCHQANPEHWKDPRSDRPSKPSRREFCARCHAPDAGGIKEAPRIDFSTHGGRYLCWQCHYPHYPEG